MNHILVFSMYFLGDWAGANWALACSKNRSRPAAMWSWAYHVIHASAVIFIVSDPWCIISLASGGALGCFFAVRRKQKRLTFISPTPVLENRGFLECNN